MGEYTQKNYSYLDGSGNKFIIKSGDQLIIEYIPVKPFYSSSGIYDGGNYTKKIITSDQFNEITSLLDTAIKKTEIHIENRVMMSGMIVIEENSKKLVYIIRPKSNILEQIEALLQSLIL